MSRKILIWINGDVHNHNALSRQPIIIKESDLIKIQTELHQSELAPEIYFEDYKCSLVGSLIGENMVYEAAESRYFSESFGYSAVRVEFDNGREVIPFDVQAKKTTVEQAKKMITYLASHSEKLVNTCFARSSLTVGTERADFVEAETMLSTAESFIDSLQSFQIELLNNLRERLVPVRAPVWEIGAANIEIDPYDVINNLDALTPSSSSGDVFLRGRNFDFDGIYVSSVRPTADVAENRILLGGLHGIRRQVGNLIDELETLDEEIQEGSDGFESFSRLMLSLTAGGMIKRSKELLGAIDRFIKLFEKKIGVSFKGEILPIMTPYVRSTRVYGLLFTQLSQWYELGTPSIDGFKFLMKLKSLSKIYEMFVFFHLIEELIRREWQIVSATPHKTMGEGIPSEIVFTKSNDRLNVRYEPIIGVLSDTTKHMDLIDVGHHSRAPNPYWSPDFVLKLEYGDAVRYVIMDAKYSTRYSVKDFHIPALFEKYYVAMAVYDGKNSIATHAPLVGVFAVFSLDDKATSYISKWGRHGINHDIPRIPMIGGIGLMTDNSSFFQSALSTILDLTKKTI